MEAKHTPGPWIITTQPGYSERWVEAPGVDVAEVRSGDADARLIAAAPDLLALVERMAHVPMGDALRYYVEIGNDARLILARATGGGA